MAIRKIGAGFAIAAMALAGVSTSALLFGTGDADAACNCVQYNDYHNTEDKKELSIKTHVSTEINAMTLAVIEALRLSTGQLTGNLREQTTADASMSDVLDDRAVVGRIEQERLQAIKDSASGASTCTVMTGGAAGSSLFGAVENERSLLTQEMAKWNLGMAGPSTGGESVAMNARLRVHCSMFSTEDDVKSGLCDAATAGEDFAYADADAGKSLLFADPNVGSRTLDDRREQAARAFIINAVNPEPLGRMANGSATTAAGRERAADRKVVQARLSIASNTMNDYLSKVKTRPNLTDGVKDLSGDLVGYSGNAFPNGASWWDWMEVQSRQWHINPNWRTKMNTGSPGQAVKDLVNIQAWSAYADWEAYKVMTDMSMNLANISAILTEMNERDKARQ